MERMSFNMIISPGFKLMNIADEHILVPIGEKAVSFKGVVTLTEASYYLLTLMKEPKSKGDLADLLVQEFDVDEETAKADIDIFVAKLLDMGVIEN